jgi:hypothetical protein
MEDSTPPSQADTRLAWLALAVFAATAALYFWIISSYGVDMLRADQWFDIKLIQRSYSGHLSFGSLWAQHGENRVFFQNLLTLALAHLTHFNVVVEEYLSALLLLGACVLIILTHRRRSPRTAWLAYCPVGLLLLTSAQSIGTLYGYAFGWYLIMAALSAALYFLDRPVLTRVALCVAILAAVVASFSSLQGLFVWPVGLVLVLQRERGRSVATAWVLSALVTAGLYFYNWDSGQGGSVGFAIRHPFEALRVFLFSVGDVVGLQLSNTPRGAQYLVLIFGVAIVAVAICSLLSAGFRTDTKSARPIGVALIWFGLLFAVGDAGARASAGTSNASFPLYVLFDILILLGSYLIVIDRSEVSVHRKKTRISRLSVLQTVICVLVGLQVVFGTIYGLSNARSYRDEQVADAVVTVHIRDAPVGLVVHQLGAGFESASFIRQMTDYARGQRLSLFSTAAVLAYARQKLPINRIRPTTALLKPADGASLQGDEFLLASGSDPYGVTKMDFVVRFSDGHQVTIGAGVPAKFGWLGAWDTRKVPDGSYALRSVAHAPGGLQGVSPWVDVRVAN